MGWQEISFRFKYTGDFGIRIRLQVNISLNPVYFDDVRIAPVLETVKSTTTGEYAPSICRLYPEEDSLLCKSESKNFIADGWYGYCLQKDPKNNNVCLLWYPIDMVKGEFSKNSIEYDRYPIGEKTIDEMFQFIQEHCK